VQPGGEDAHDWHRLRGCEPSGVPHLQEPPPPWDPAVGLCLGSWGCPRGVGEVPLWRPVCSQEEGMPSTGTGYRGTSLIRNSSPPSRITKEPEVSYERGSPVSYERGTPVSYPPETVSYGRGTPVAPCVPDKEPACSQEEGMPWTGTGYEAPVKRFRGRLVFNAHRLVYHSTLGSQVIHKKKKLRGSWRAAGPPSHHP